MRATQRVLTVVSCGLVLFAAACSPPRFDDGVTVEESNAAATYQPEAPPIETALLGESPGRTSGSPTASPNEPVLPAENYLFEMAPIPNPPERGSRRGRSAQGERDSLPEVSFDSPPPRQARPATKARVTPTIAAPKLRPKTLAENKAPSESRTLAERVTPKPAPKAPAPKPEATASGKLAQGLTPDVTAARFALPKTLADRGQGVVTLTLPVDFAERLAEEASKAGLGKDAGTADAQARLKGVGYGIAPSDPQTIRVRKGEPTVFTWLITEAGSKSARRGVLSADVGVELSGGDAPRQIPIASVSANAAPLDPTPNSNDARSGWRNFALTIPLLLILIGIFAFIRWSRSREAERRAKTVRRDAVAS